MYYTHDLRTNLQEWKNRLYQAPDSQFGSQFLYFFKNLESEPILYGLLEEASRKFNIDERFAKDWLEEYSYEFLFQNEEKQAAVFYHVSKYIIQEWGANRVANMSFLAGRNFGEKKANYLETFINPVVEYLYDRIDKSNSILYLLEKYKNRIEWFKREELYNRYKAAEKGYEQILEDDLRLFLYDQGVDYPFSTPKSFSGRADIVGLIDTEEPLIAEVKIYDSEKGYRKDRVVSGLSQIIKYANDYGKESGYLVIYNLDNAEIVLKLKVGQKKFPPRIVINNKVYYFIIINLYHGFTASKIGKTNIVEIHESELLNGIKNECDLPYNDA